METSMGDEHISVCGYDLDAVNPSSQGCPSFWISVVVTTRIRKRRLLFDLPHAYIIDR